MKMLSEKIRQRLLPVLKRHDVIRAAIFGSFARGERDRVLREQVVIDEL